MPRQRKSPTKSMLGASERLSGLKTIDNALDLGNGLTAAPLIKPKLMPPMRCWALIIPCSRRLTRNPNLFDALEKELRDLNERYLLAVAVK